jgi:hypothetical protein
VVVADAKVPEDIEGALEVTLTMVDDTPSKTCFSVTTLSFVAQQSVEFPQHHLPLVAVPSQGMT